MSLVAPINEIISGRVLLCNTTRLIKPRRALCRDFSHRLIDDMKHMHFGTHKRSVTHKVGCVCTPGVTNAHIFYPQQAETALFSGSTNRVTKYNNNNNNPQCVLATALAVQPLKAEVRVRLVIGAGDGENPASTTPFSSREADWLQRSSLRPARLSITHAAVTAAARQTPPGWS